MDEYITIKWELKLNDAGRKVPMQTKIHKSEFQICENSRDIEMLIEDYICEEIESLTFDVKTQLNLSDTK